MDKMHKQDKEIYQKFTYADSVIQAIRQIYERRMHDAEGKATAKAFPMAFVHPELKDIAKRADNFTANQPANRLLDRYALDGENLPNTLSAHPFIRLLDDIRAGVFHTASEGQRVGAGEDSGSSAVATQGFNRDVERMVNTIEEGKSGEQYTTAANAASMVDAAEKKVAQAIAVRNAIKPNTLFGYDINTVPGRSKSEKADNWKYLEKLEHWYYYAFDNAANVSTVGETEKETTVNSWGEDLYVLTENYKKFVDENPDVKELAVSLAKYYSANNINVNADEVDPVTVSQVLGMMLLGSNTQKQPGVMNRAVDELCAADPDNAETYQTALSKVVALRKSIKTSNPMDKVNLTRLSKSIAGYQHDNQTAADLFNIMRVKQKTRKGRYTAPLTNILVKHGNPGNDSGKFDTACIIGEMLLQPELMAGLISDPQTPPVSADTTKSDNAAKLKENTGLDTPYDRAMTYLGRTRSETFRDIGKDFSIPVREMSPESDVTGAMLIPDVAVPLFAEIISYPEVNVGDEEDVYRRGITLATYLTMHLSENPAGLPKPEWLGEETDDEGTITGWHIIANKLNSVDAIKQDIQKCFGSFRIGRPANPIDARNAWLQHLTDPEKWMKIAKMLIDYFSSQDLPEKTQERLGEIVLDIREHVLRNIFDVKSGNVAFAMPDGQVVHAAKPYDPVNRTSKGRLRKSGGIDGSITRYGCAIIANTKGTVDAVTGTNNKRTFTLSFDTDSIPQSCTVSEKELDRWVPPALITFIDPDTGTKHYAVWVGLRFCSVMTDEGFASTTRIPEEILNAANEVYRETTGYTGAVGGQGVEGADAIVKRVGSTSAEVMSAINAVNDSLDSNKRNAFETMFNTLSAAKKLGFGDAGDAAKLLRSGNKPVDPSKLANDVTTALFNDIFNKFGADVDTDAYRSIGSIVAYCEETGLDYRVKLLRAYSGLNAILSPAGTDDGLMVGCHPFTVSLSDNRVTATVTDEYTDYSVDGDSAGIMAFLESDAMESKDALMDWLQFIDGAGPSDVEQYSDQIAEAITRSVDTLRALQKKYMTDIIIPGSYIRNAEARGVLDTLSDEKFTETLADAIRTISPVVQNVTELANVGIDSVFYATEDVANLHAGLSKYKQEKTPDEYNKGFGVADPMYVHGEDADESLEQYANREITDEARVTASIVGDLDAFDSDTNKNYSSVTSFPMLGMIRTDPTGMGSGQDNFDIEHGLSPSEFEDVARLLDDAQLYMDNALGGARGKNISIRQFVKRMKTPINEFINTFYRFMTDGQLVTDTENPILEKASTVRDAANLVAKSCQDLSIKDELTECADEFSALLDRVAATVPEQYTSRAEANKAIAGYLSTAVANIILYLGSLNVDASISQGAGGLEQYGNTGDVRLGIGNTGLYSTVSAINQGEGSRMRSVGVNTPNRLFIDRVSGGLNGADRFVTTLANFYTTLGMDKTAGYEEAINPFEDIVKKLNTKATMGYRKVYKGESKTDLGAVLVWAINADESRNDENYSMVASVVNHLIRQKAPQPAHLEVPAFVVEGLDVQEYAGGKKLNLDERIDIFIGTDGKAIYATDFDVPDEILKQIDGFSGIDDVWDATKLDTPEGVQIGPETTPEGLARAVRLSIIDDKLAHSSALSSISISDDENNGRKYAPVVQKTVDMVKKAARNTKSAGDLFVPFSVVYASIDETYLSMAMSKVSESAHDALIRKANETTYRDIYRRIYGDDGSEKLSSAMSAHRNDIIYALAMALGSMTDGRLDFNAREDVLNAQRPLSQDNPEETVPDSSLNVIMGTAASKFLDGFIRECGKKVTDDTTPAEMVDIAEAYVNKFFNPAGDLGSIAGLLSSIAAGEVSYSEGIAKITATLGAKTDKISKDLFDNYLTMLGTPGDREAAMAVNEVKRRNIATRLVRAVMGSNSEFRNIYRASHGSDIGDVHQARLYMHGKSPLPNVERIGGTNPLYNKTAAALSGKMPEDEAAEFLESVNFKINGEGGKQAISEFNKIVNNVTQCIKSLITSTRKGIASSDMAERENNKMGSNAFDMENAGEERKADLENLDAALDLAKQALKLRKPESKPEKSNVPDVSAWTNNGLTRTINDIVNTYCSWQVHASEDKLAEKVALLKDRNVIRGLCDTIREEFAKTFAVGRLYQRGVEEIATVASMYRGVGSDTKLPIDKIRHILTILDSTPASPIRKSDSDVVGDYLINGYPVEFEDCVGIVNDAVDMYLKSANAHEDMTGADITDEQVRSPEFIECIRRNLSTEKDYALSTDAIIELFLRNMIASRNLGKSNVLPYGVTKYYTCNDADRNSHRFKFDIPLDIVRDIVNDALRNMKTTVSANQWAQFAEDFAKYTAAGNRSRNDEIADPAIKDEMVTLFNKVFKSLNTRLGKAAAGISFDRLSAGRPVETDDGILVSWTGGPMEDGLQPDHDLRNVLYNPD